MGMIYFGFLLVDNAARFNYIGLIIIVLIGSIIQTLFDYFKSVKVS